MRTSLLTMAMTALLASALLTGCQEKLPEPTTSGSTDAADQRLEQLQKSLEDAGLEVEVPDSRAKPSFWYSADYDLYTVEGLPLQTYAFKSSEEASAAAVGVSDDGFTIDEGAAEGLIELSWSAPPHFFRDEELIVIFVDEAARTDAPKSDRVLKALRDALGSEFAQGPPPQ